MRPALAMFGKPAWSAELGFGVVQGGYARFRIRPSDAQMVMARWAPMQMEAAKRLGQRLIVDVDDHYDKIGEDNIAFHTTDPTVNPIHNRDNFRKVVELADVVTVTTPELYDHYAPHVKDIRLIRNGVNPKQFTRHKQKNRKPVIGWVGAIGWRQADVEMLRPWLGPWLEKHDLMFPPRRAHARPAVVRGALPIWTRLGVYIAHGGDHRVRVHAHVRHRHRADDRQPVQPSQVHEQGLEYALSGIPFVASALPEYERWRTWAWAVSRPTTGTGRHSWMRCWITACVSTRRRCSTTGCCDSTPSCSGHRSGWSCSVRARHHACPTRL